MKEKNILEEDCDREMCIEGGQMCHHRRQNFACPPAPCCPGLDCEYVDAHQESFCVSMDNPLEKYHTASSQRTGISKKNGLTAEESSPLYTLKGMFQGFVEKIEKKHCLPHGEQWKAGHAMYETNHIPNTITNHSYRKPPQHSTDLSSTTNSLLSEEGSGLHITSRYPPTVSCITSIKIYRNTSDPFQIPILPDDFLVNIREVTSYYSTH
ncbi:hypothetical protein EYC80_004128 [Monilinia laxa]|uniref:Uncharacterized protein n=1 Tax=Monilinia laxa TaxID=61186 RepID=A0A5N6KLS0_MONLA|nr:hypothetical protein EYC80_004128 [Monilinia laxa]